MIFLKLFIPFIFLSLELLSCIRKKVEAGKLSSDIATRLEELFYNYRNAVSPAQNADTPHAWISYNYRFMFS